MTKMCCKIQYLSPVLKELRPLFLSQTDKTKKRTSLPGKVRGVRCQMFIGIAPNGLYVCRQRGIWQTKRMKQIILVRMDVVLIVTSYHQTLHMKHKYGCGWVGFIKPEKKKNPEKGENKSSEETKPKSGGTNGALNWRSKQKKNTEVQYIIRSIRLQLEARR